MNEESLCREKKTENFQNDSVVVSPPTLEKWVEEINMENERLLHDELQECKAREKISMFGRKNVQVVMKIYNFILDFLKVDCMWSVKTIPTYSRCRPSLSLG